MHVLEIYHDMIDWRQFPSGLRDFANDIALKADKDRTPAQREQFKQEIIHRVEADRLMMAQQVEVRIIGASAQFWTLWGDRPVSGQGFEDVVSDALIAAGDGDPFVVYALASETVLRVNRQLLHGKMALQALPEGERPMQITLAQVEAVIADKAVVVQAARDARQIQEEQ